MFEQSIELSEKPLEVLHHLVNNVIPRFEQDGNLEEYPLLNSDTIVHHYQVCSLSKKNNFISTNLIYPGYH